MHRYSFAFVLVLASCAKSGGPASPPPGPGPMPPAPESGAPAEPAPVAAGDPCPQEMGKDAPDGLDGALPLEAGTTKGCYGANDKKDTFVLTAPGQTPVAYHLRVQSRTGQGCLTAYDANKAITPKLDLCVNKEGEVREGWVVVMGGTQWYLQTRDLKGSTLASAEPYTLDVEATPLEDPGEPDAMEKPVALALGEAKKAFLTGAANATKMDHDYFVVEVPKDMKKKTRFDVNVTDVPSDVQVAVVVYDGSGKKIGEKGASNPGAALKADIKMKGPGKYIFHLRNIHGTSDLIGHGQPLDRAQKPYTITVNAP
jgi:hypothetical protein